MKGSQLWGAIIVCDHELIKELLKEGENAAGGADCPASYGGTTFLMLASQTTRCDQCPKLLLDAGANLHAVDRWGRDALCYAVGALDAYRHKDSSVIRLLLRRGATYDRLFALKLSPGTMRSQLAHIRRYTIMVTVLTMLSKPFLAMVGRDITRIIAYHIWLLGRGK